MLRLGDDSRAILAECERDARDTWDAADDADRAYFAGDPNATFDYDPTPDWEGMEYDDWHAAPKCGGAEYPDGRDRVNVGCPGCRHCFPPDYDAIPTGFDPWEVPGYARVRDELWFAARLGYALPPHPIDCPAGYAALLRMVNFNARLAAAAEFKLARICERCETHPEAKAEYEAWASMYAEVAESQRAAGSEEIPF
jgi:hypothetical protein